MTNDCISLEKELQTAIAERNKRRLDRAKKDFDSAWKELLDKTNSFRDYLEDFHKLIHYLMKQQGTIFEYDVFKSFGMKPEDLLGKDTFALSRNSYSCSGSFNSPSYSYYENKVLFHPFKPYNDVEGKISWVFKTYSKGTYADSFKVFFDRNTNDKLKEDKEGDFTLKVAQLIRSAIAEVDCVHNAHQKFVAKLKDILIQKQGEC